MVYRTEKKLVSDFKESFNNSLQPSGNIVLLEEVKTSWGIVDILAIKYDQRILNFRRTQIKKVEVPRFTNLASYAISYIIEHPYINTEELGAYLRVKNGLLEETIGNLQKRGLISRFSNKKLRAKTINKNYTIKEIIAFEAKLTNWKKAVDQAERHLWFTNSSYVVLPNLTKNVIGRVTSTCAEKGIGLIIQIDRTKFQIIKRPLCRHHIDSIFSWKLNEALVDRSACNGFNPLR